MIPLISPLLAQLEEHNRGCILSYQTLKITVPFQEKTPHHCIPMIPLNSVTESSNLSSFCRLSHDHEPQQEMEV